MVAVASDVDNLLVFHGPWMVRRSPLLVGLVGVSGE
jgi:hypothetical protein